MNDDKYQNCEDDCCGCCGDGDHNCCHDEKDDKEKLLKKKAKLEHKLEEINKKLADN